MVDRSAEAKASGKIDWLASYPKSGNTWLRLLLANYFSERDEPYDINKLGTTNGIASSRWRFDELLGVNSADLRPSDVHQLQPHVYEMMTARCPGHQWMKVHDAQTRLPDGRWLFPTNVSGAVIYLIRNPLDVAVSMAFHDGHEDMTQAVEKMCNSDAWLAEGGSTQLSQHVGSWSHHVASWVDQIEIPVLTLRYEDMVADTPLALKQVIGFARPGVGIDPHRLDLAVRHASFDRLQAAEDATGFGETPAKSKRFFRSGRPGDWRGHLSRDLIVRICDCHATMMDRFGYAAI
jgi:aryl sulfotransferase